MQIYQKYKTLIRYLIFGLLTTLINIAAYATLSKLLDIPYMISSVMAWIVAVLFAYVTNRLYVFESKGKGFNCILGECSAFFGCRLFSGLVDTASMFVMIHLLQFNDLLVKVVSNVFVIGFNYLFSKRVIFGNKDQGEVGL